MLLWLHMQVDGNWETYEQRIFHMTQQLKCAGLLLAQATTAAAPASAEMRCSTRLQHVPSDRGATLCSLCSCSDYIPEVLDRKDAG